MLRNLTKLIIASTHQQRAVYATNKIHTTSKSLAKESTKTLDSKEVKTIGDILAKYNGEQEEKILKIINSHSLEELLGYEITKGRASKLLAWRTRYSSLKSLNDIFFIEGFIPKVADKFLQSLLLEPKPSKSDLDKSSTRVSTFITPSMEEVQRDSIKSCVSVRIGVNSITWSRLKLPNKDDNAPSLLTHWDHYEISGKKLHLNELIQRCIYVNYYIPTADCYLFENPQTVQPSASMGSVEQQNISIQKSHITAIMGYALASRNRQLRDIPSDGKIYCPNVFYVRRFLTARLFNHLVGHERVSSEQTILTMMRTFYNTNEEAADLRFEQDQTMSQHDQLKNNSEVNLCGHVQFPTELREMFSEALRYHREFLGQALLLNLAFIRLVLMQDLESLATVSRGNKAKTGDIKK